jgi:hypothetical protein
VFFLASQRLLNEQLEAVTTIFGPGITPSALLQEVTKYRTSLDSLSRAVKSASDQFIAAGEPYKAIIEAEPNLKALNEQIKKSFSEFEPAIVAVKDPIQAANATRLFKSLAPGINNSSRTFVSLPLQFTKEESRLEINIQPRSDSTTLLQSYNTVLVFPTATHDQFWGISSGFYLSTPANESYSTIANIAADTTYSIVKEKPGKMEFGFNTMMRFGSRISTNVYWQAGIGPGVSVSDKVRPRMLIGTGLAFGQKHSILLDIGAVFGYYNVKSKAFENTDGYATEPKNITVSQIKTGAYFSISYLFLK